MRGDKKKNLGEDYRRWIIHHSDPDFRGDATALREDLWPKALECAIHHGVLPIIHDKLQKAGVAIPLNSLSTVRDYLLLQTLRIHWQKRFLIHLGRQIQNLPDFMVFKGLGLATQLYSDFYQRPVGDVDILIRRKDSPFWLSFLKEIGFIPTSSSLGAKDDIKLLNTGQGLFEHPMILELHCELLDYRKRHVWPNVRERVWGNREFISIDGEMIPVMGLPDLLPYLCVHQFLHWHSRLIWVVDLLLLVRKHAPDVFEKEALAVMASNPAVQACVYYALHYAQILFELPEVAGVMRELRPPRTSLYGYVPLLRAEEFLNDKAFWPSVKKLIELLLFTTLRS